KGAVQKCPSDLPGIRYHLGRGCSNDDRRWLLKIDLFARQGSVHERLLLIVSRIHDVVTHVAEKEFDLEPRIFQMPQQCRRIRTVTARSITCGSAIAGRIGDKHVFCGLNRGKPEIGNGSRTRLWRLPREWVVPASVENDQAELFCVCDGEHRCMQTYRLGAHINVILQSSVDR